MKRSFFCLTALFFIFHFPAAAEETVFTGEAETAFREIGSEWLKLEQDSSRKGTAPEWLALQLKKIREDFKSFALENAESPWADDAYFFAAALESQRSKLLEGKLFLIQNYPESSAEEWTQNALSFALPAIEPLDAGVRMDICLEYLKAGETRELEILAIESAEKYPELATQFEILVAAPEEVKPEKKDGK